MISPQELRIGSWVNITVEGKDGVFNQNAVIEEIRKDVILFNNGIHAAYGMLFPIPLTEDILLRCGFEKTHTTWKNGWFELWYSSYAESFQVRLFKIGSDTEKIINIQSLHQLQNLYFALVGKELEVKL